MSEANLTTCSRSSEIAAYLDGELEPQTEIAFERHLSGCSICSTRLNEQKRLLCALDFAFDDEKSFALPKDFARQVAIRAESDVSGLRDKNERFRAVWLISLLFSSGVAVGFVGKKSGLMPVVLENAFKLVSLLGTILYDFTVGLVVVLRVASRHFFSSAPFFGMFLLVLFVVSLFALSRLLGNYHREQNR